MDQFARTALLLGEEGVRRLHGARVAVFGLGGVGGHAVEALVRSGVGAIDLIDGDRVSLTNLNRQLIATHDTVGRPKAEVMAERLLAICPQCLVTPRTLFYLPENAGSLDLGQYDYVLDAVDTVTAKLTLVLQARAADTPIISAMGAGNKLDPTLLRTVDISETSVDPLSRVMRRELKRRGILHLKVVFSPEPPLQPSPEARQACREEEGGGGTVRRDLPGSVAFVPSVMGLIMAGEVVKDIALNRLNKPLRAEQAKEET